MLVFGGSLEIMTCSGLIQAVCSSSLSEVTLISKFPDLNLVFVGREDYFYHKLKKIVKNKKIKNIVFTGHVYDYDLDILQHNAVAYIFPSLYEGFGLPPLEAMAKGTPVISSNHPCMQEILGESAYYFDAKIETEITKAIEEVLTNNVLREKLILAGYKQIKKYSWKKMAKETLLLYKNVKINRDD